MKLANCVVGTKVQVKNARKDGVLYFYAHNRGEVGTIIRTPDSDGDVRVELDDGTYDTGHHTNLRKYKGEQA